MELCWYEAYGTAPQWSMTVMLRTCEPSESTPYLPWKSSPCWGLTYLEASDWKSGTRSRGREVACAMRCDWRLSAPPVPPASRCMNWRLKLSTAEG